MTGISAARPHPFITALFVFLLTLASATGAQAQEAHPAAAYGVRYTCAADQLEPLRAGMAHYLLQLGIPAHLVRVNIDRPHGQLTYALAGPSENTRTLYLAWRTELAIQDEEVQVPISDQETRPLKTVSRKEILLALLHPGRLTEFKGQACDVQALIDHVGIRQTTVMWAEVLHWGWPDGDAAEWNTRYWQQGTPLPDVALHDALNDLFFQQDKYSIGCYTATKIVFAQGALDYYRRIKQDPEMARRVAERLLADREPLVDVEPGRMWSFEPDFEPAEAQRPGKLLRMVEGVASDNFVPGDWIYLLNTDAQTYQRTGYEGSNAIYLGRNRFDDYYNDNNHYYSYKEKLSEVFQWRHGVFNRRRDFAKHKPLAPQDYERLSATPENGGMLLGYRVVPYLFGFEPLPELPVTAPAADAPAPGTPAAPALPAPVAASGG